MEMVKENLDPNRKYLNPEMECMPIEELRKLQLKKLQKQVKYCYDNSPYYYKKKFDASGAKPEDIKTLDDWRRLPIMRTKEGDRESQKESMEREGHPFGMYLCAPPEKVVYISSTSGTTGEPTFTYLFTEHDIKINDEVWQRVFWRAGIRPGDVVLQTFGLSMWVGGIPVVRALQNMGCRALPVGAEGGTEKMLRLGDYLKATAIIGTPPLAEHLIEKCPEILGKPIGALGIKQIVCAGAPGAGLPEVRKKIESAYGAKLFDSTGGGWGLHHVSCDYPEYQGMHVVCEDFAIWYDIVDPATNEPIEWKDGAIGHGLITAFDHEASPAIKYAMGDLIQINTTPCPCGNPGWRFRILSRVDDMLIVKGINVYPSAVKNAINAFVPRVTGEMRIILEKPGPRVEPPMKIKVEYGSEVKEADLPSLKKELEDKMSAQLRVRPDITFVPPNTLERAAGPSAKGKLVEKLFEAKK
jgi:phenylacetate-CoA ligase